MTEENYFIQLNKIDVSEKTEKKGDLTYLSWAWAWGEIKKKHPTAEYKIYETPEGCIYWTDSKTCWVKVSVTISGLEHIEYLPVLDYRNKPIPVDQITSFNANTSIQRALTKAIARHGLGLYIYAGEDLPEEEKEQKKQESKAKLNKKYTDQLEKLANLSTKEAWLEEAEKEQLVLDWIKNNWSQEYHDQMKNAYEMAREQWMNA